MKSKTSCFNKAIFKKNITHFWPIWLVFIAWNLFILPFMIYNTSLQYSRMHLSAEQLKQNQNSDILSLVSVFTNPGIIFAFTLVVVVAVFSYLYNNRAANTFHALPVTRKELFVTNYVSGLLFLIVPQVIAFLAGMLVSALCGYTNANQLFIGLLFAMGISFFFYSFTVFIAMFTGQSFAVPVFAVILNFLYVGAKMLFSNLRGMLAYGISANFNSGKLDLLSPLYYFIDKVAVDYDYSGEYAVSTGLTGSKVVAAYALAAVVFVIAAYLVYRKRDIETAGSLISVPWICPIFRWGAAFCGGCLFSEMFCDIIGIRSNRGIFYGLLLLSILFSTVFFFVAQMFLEKGFRVFRKKRLLECGVMLAAVVVLLLGIEFDWTGQEKKMPDPSKVDRAYINSVQIAGGSDSEVIAKIMDIHSQMIASKKEFEAFVAENDSQADYYDGLSDGYGTAYVSIKYFLKNGSTLQRHYEVPCLKEMLMDSTTVIGKTLDLCLTPEVYLKNQICSNYEDMKFSHCNIDLYDGGRERREYVFSTEDTDKIYQAIVQDAKEGNFRNIISDMYNYYESSGDDYYNTINFEYYNKNGIVSMHEEYMQEPQNRYGFTRSSGGSITFDDNCKNLIAALIETGAIESVDDLVTKEVWNKEAEALEAEEDVEAAVQ